jgi:hypothetical protein
MRFDAFWTLLRRFAAISILTVGLLAGGFQAQAAPPIWRVHGATTGAARR